MKVTIIGSGSIFFTRQCVKAMARSRILGNTQVALVDIDPWKNDQMGEFCRKINRDNGGGLDISYTTDRKEALAGSDYVVLSFAIGNYHYRETSTNLALNYGIRMVSSETAGPGMVFRVVRAVPGVLEVARDIESLCPDALVINYVNPTNIIGTALDRHTKLRSYAFCDGSYGGLVPRVAGYLGIENVEEAEERLTFKVGGINHFTFLTELWDRGRDVWQEFKEGLAKAAEADGMCKTIRAEWEFCETFDVFLTQVFHSIEYVRYFQGKGGKPERDYKVKRWSLNRRIKWYKNVWLEIEECNKKDLSTLDLMKDSSSDMVAAIIESIEGDLNRRFSVNVRNDKRISNLPDDVLVELYGTIGRDGPDVPEFGALPRGVLGLTQQVIDQQELALEAAMTGSFETAVRAIAADPTVMSFNDARDLARDHIAIEEDHMDRKWDEYWRESDR